MNLFCVLWKHDDCIEEEWYPSVDAPIVVKWVWRATCRRCGRVEEHIFDYEKSLIAHNLTEK